MRIVAKCCEIQRADALSSDRYVQAVLRDTCPLARGLVETPPRREASALAVEMTLFVKYPPKVEVVKVNVQIVLCCRNRGAESPSRRRQGVNATSHGVRR